MIQKIKNLSFKLLRKSEKYTHTDMVYLAKGGFWLTLGHVISIFSSFILAMAFANLLPSETYGSYKYVLSILSILSITTLNGINTSTGRSIARDFDKTIIVALKTKIKWGLLGSLASLGIGVYYLINNNDTLSIIFLILAAFIPIMDSGQLYSSFLQGKKLFKDITKYDIISKIITTSIIIATMLITKNLIFVVLSYVVSWTIIKMVFLKITLKKINPQSSIEKGSISYGKKLSLIKGLNTFSSNLSSIVLFHFLGSASLAVFSLAIAPIEQIRSVLKIVNPLASSKMARDEWQIPGVKEFIRKFVIPPVIVTSLIIAIYILLAPTLFGWFFPKYLPSIKYSQIYSLSLLLTIINIVQNTILDAKKKIREIYTLNIVDIVLNIGLVVPMIYIFGIWGLIYNIIIIKFVEAMLMFLMIHKKGPFHKK